MKTDLQTKKEQLQKELNSIQEKEQKEIVSKHYPIFKKKYQGKCFKMKNHYGNPRKRSDYWFVYIKVTEIKPEDIYDTRGNGVTSHYTGWQFQTDSSYNVSIQKKETGYIHSLGQQIPESEFNEAWDKVINGLNKMRLI